MNKLPFNDITSNTINQNQSQLKRSQRASINMQESKDQNKNVRFRIYMNNYSDDNYIIKLQLTNSVTLRMIKNFFQNSLNHLPMIKNDRLNKNKMIQENKQKLNSKKQSQMIEFRGKFKFNEVELDENIKIQQLLNENKTQNVKNDFVVDFQFHYEIRKIQKKHQSKEDEMIEQFQQKIRKMAAINQVQGGDDCCNIM